MPDAVTTDEEGFPVLKGELFWKWRALQSDLRRLDADIALHSKAVDAELDKLPELRELLHRRTSAIQQRMTAGAEYKELLVTLEKHLGFPMTNVSIDDVSGRVHRLEEGAPASPAKEAPAPKAQNGVNGHAKPKIAPVPSVKPSTPSKKPKKRK